MEPDAPSGRQYPHSTTEGSNAAGDERDQTRREAGQPVTQARLEAGNVQVVSTVVLPLQQLCGEPGTATDTNSIKAVSEKNEMLFENAPSVKGLNPQRRGL
jgi:uncharacterized protein YcnI